MFRDIDLGLAFGASALGPWDQSLPLGRRVHSFL